MLLPLSVSGTRVSEFVELFEWAEGRFSESRFVFLIDFVLLDCENGRGASGSEAAEESAEDEAELSPWKRPMAGFSAGVSMRREAGGPFRRACIFDLGLGVCSSVGNIVAGNRPNEVHDQRVGACRQSLS